MPWYRVSVKEGDLDAAYQSLRGAGITMREQVYAHFVDAGPPKLHSLAAVVEADHDDEAESKVRELLGSDDYALEASELKRSSRSG